MSGCSHSKIAHKWLHTLLGKNRKTTTSLWLWSMKLFQSISGCNSVNFALPQPKINVENKANIKLMGARRHGQGGGHLPPGNVVKCFVKIFLKSFLVASGRFSISVRKKLFTCAGPRLTVPTLRIFCVFRRRIFLQKYCSPDNIVRASYTDIKRTLSSLHHQMHRQFMYFSYDYYY